MTETSGIGKSDVGNGLIPRKARLVNCVEDKRFALENPVTFHGKRDSIVCPLYFPAFPFPPAPPRLFTRVVIPRQCGVIRAPGKGKRWEHGTGKGLNPRWIILQRKQAGVCRIRSPVFLNALSPFPPIVRVITRNLRELERNRIYSSFILIFGNVCSTIIKNFQQSHHWISNFRLRFAIN